LTKVERTPFVQGCIPGDILDDYRMHLRRVTPMDYMRTAQLFLSFGEDLEEVAGNSGLMFQALFPIKGWVCTSLHQEMPPLWLWSKLKSITGSLTFDSSWWLAVASWIIIRSTDPQHPMTDIAEEILSHLRTTQVQKLLLEWIQGKLSRADKVQNWHIETFQRLVTFSGGIHYMAPIGDRHCSPLTMACFRSQSFAHFKILLRECSFDINEVIRAQVDICRDWTEAQLRDLFNVEFASFRDRGQFECKLCKRLKRSMRLWENEIPWSRTVSRLEAGNDINGALNEKEKREQEYWEGHVEAAEQHICRDCYKRRLREMEGEDSSPFLLDLWD
jgi:hypothetical protein